MPLIHTQTAILARNRSFSGEKNGMVLLRAKVYYQSKLHCLDYKPFLCTWHVLADHLMKISIH